MSSRAQTRKLSHTKLVDLKSALEEIRSKLNVIKGRINSTRAINNTYDTVIIQGPGEFEGKIIAKEIEVHNISGDPANELLNDIVK